MQILAVDDDEIMLDLLSAAMLAVGYDNVTLAAGGAEALQIMADTTEPFECFLLDVKMPKMSGIQLCKKIRKFKGHEKTPIIMITAVAGTDSVERAVDAGATDYVIKPFDIFELGHRIKLAETLVGEIQSAKKNVEKVETRFRDLYEITTDWFWEQDENCKFTKAEILWETPFFNDVNKQVFGRTRWEIAGVDPNEDDYWKLHVEDLAARRSFRDFQYSLVDLNGEEHFLSVNGTPAFGESGKFEGYRGTVRDITTLVSAQHSNDRFLYALENMSEGLVLWDEDDKYVFSNKSLRKITGLVGEALRPGLGFESWMRDHLKYENISDLENGAEAWLSENLDRFRKPVGEYELLRNGRWQLHRFEKLPDGHTMQSIRDINNTKLSEDALRQSQRLQAIGQLTGGIAHDFNNLLSVMVGNVEILEDIIGGDEAAQRSIDALYLTINRGAALISRIMAFSRQQNLLPEPTSIDGMIDELTPILQRMLGATIELHTRFEPNTGLAMIDVPQFENALLNLVVNAKHAMPTGGSVTIKVTSFTQVHAQVEQGEELIPGEYIKVAVTDTGTGMPSEILKKVFEPFFTTKDVGKGSGLGLSMVFGFIRQSKGGVAITSKVGDGTTVTMYLPKTEKTPDDSSIEHSVNSPKQLAKHILIVEDDEAVRKIAVNILVNHGYEVRVASDGAEALNHLSSGFHFDLLFTDIVLPNGMSGLEISDEATRIQPHIKVLFTSGYAREAFAESETMNSEILLLDKPYRRAVLLEKVQALLKVDGIP